MTAMIRRIETIPNQRLDDDLVLVNAHTRQVHLLIESQTCDSLVGQLAEEFDASEEQIRSDVNAFLVQLERESLVEAIES
jgi:hypothetical protein